MQRRRFLVLAGAVSLAGCSDGRSPAAGSSPGDGTPTETAGPTPTGGGEQPSGGTADVEAAAEALSAARSGLVAAAAAFGARAVPPEEVTEAFAFDRRALDGGVADAETHARNAIALGDEHQIATGEAYLSLAAALRSLGDAHAALSAAAKRLGRAAAAEADGDDAGAVVLLGGARDALDEADAALRSAESDRRAFERGTDDAELSGAVGSDIEACSAVAATLSALVGGRRGRLSGVAGVEVGIDAFRGDDYRRATRAFVEAFEHFDEAAAVTGSYEGDLVVEAVAEERCLAAAYRDAAETFQGASLEAEAGNLSEAFDGYREGLSQYRAVGRRC